MFESSGEMTPPCGVPATVAVTRPSSVTPAWSHCRINLSTRRSETRRGHERQELAVVDAAEVVTDVGIEDVIAASRATRAQSFQRLRRTPLRPEAIRAREKIRLEDGLQH